MNEVRDLLNKVRKINVERAALIEQRESIFTSLTSTTIKPKVADVQTSGAGDQMAEKVPEIVELTQQINDLINGVIADQMKANAIIRCIPETRYRTVLELYYINGKRWNVVAAKMDYDPVYIRDLGIQALSRAQEVYDGKI